MGKTLDARFRMNVQTMAAKAIRNAISAGSGFISGCLYITRRSAAN
ncbi:hypothetical protein [Pseudomonas sp. efr-133-TYG-5]|nr:hypothetical protein [Pseudomonas sp. efr-133-TYG-5]